jgi:hypothetical protein
VRHGDRGSGAMAGAPPQSRAADMRWVGMEGWGIGGQGACHESVKEEAGRRTSLKEEVQTRTLRRRKTLSRVPPISRPIM